MKVLRRPGIRPARVMEDGASGVSEALIADQASGCGRFIARKVFISAGGRTARFGSAAGTLLALLEGTAGIASPEGGLEIILPGDSVVLAAGEECRVINHGDDRVVLLKVEGIR